MFFIVAITLLYSIDLHGCVQCRLIDYSIMMDEQRHP